MDAGAQGGSAARDLPLRAPAAERRRHDCEPCRTAVPIVSVLLRHAGMWASGKRCAQATSDVSLQGQPCDWRKAMRSETGESSHARAKEAGSNALIARQAQVATDGKPLVRHSAR